MVQALHLSPIIVAGRAFLVNSNELRKGVRVTSLPAQCGGKVWSWKEIGFCFFSPHVLKSMLGKTSFGWLAWFH